MSERDAIEGIGYGDDDGVSPGIKAWQNYLDMQDQADAAGVEAASAQQHLEEEARSGHVQGPSTGSLLAAGAALVAPQISEDDRMAVMGAMQAEALSRLELAPHIDNVNAAVRSAEGLDEASRLETHQEATIKRHEGALQDREQQKGPDSLARPDDFVARTEGHESRTASERLADRDSHARRDG